MTLLIMIEPFESLFGEGIVTPSIIPFSRFEKALHCAGQIVSVVVWVWLKLRWWRKSIQWVNHCGVVTFNEGMISNCYSLGHLSTYPSPSWYRVKSWIQYHLFVIWVYFHQSLRKVSYPVEKLFVIDTHLFKKWIKQVLACSIRQRGRGFSDGKHLKNTMFIVKKHARDSWSVWPFSTGFKAWQLCSIWQKG